MTLERTTNSTPPMTPDTRPTKPSAPLERERARTTITGGVWGELDDFIALNGGDYIRLMDLAGGEFSESADYRVVTKPDCDMNGRDDFFEVLDGTLDPCGGAPSCPPDFNGSGTVDSADLAVLLAAWGMCP